MGCPSTSPSATGRRRCDRRQRWPRVTSHVLIASLSVPRKRTGWADPMCKFRERDKRARTVFSSSVHSMSYQPRDIGYTEWKSILPLETRLQLVSRGFVLPRSVLRDGEGTTVRKLPTTKPKKTVEWASLKSVRSSRDFCDDPFSFLYVKFLATNSIEHL